MEATTAEIVTAILVAAGGRGESAWVTMVPRLHANLAYLERRRSRPAVR